MTVSSCRTASVAPVPAPRPTSAELPNSRYPAAARAPPSPATAGLLPRSGLCAAGREKGRGGAQTRSGELEAGPRSGAGAAGQATAGTGPEPAVPARYGTAGPGETAGRPVGARGGAGAVTSRGSGGGGASSRRGGGLGRW